MNKESPIIIVEAGIFGLSTALHLASSGYLDVTVFDRHPVDKSRYSYLQGCDGASAGKLLNHTATKVRDSNIFLV